MDIMNLIQQELATMRQATTPITEDICTDVENGDAIPFGKWKGSLIQNVPPEHRTWLCCWQHMPDLICEDHDGDCDWRCYKVRKYRPQWDKDWRHWVRSKFPNTVAKARKHVKERILCNECGKAFVSIGYSRFNGKAHNDWTNRTLHKKCWMEIMEHGRIPYDDAVETDVE